jgi:hypothetical protein
MLLVACMDSLTFNERLPRGVSTFWPGISFPIFVAPRWGKNPDNRIRQERFAAANERAKIAEQTGKLHWRRLHVFMDGKA